MLVLFSALCLALVQKPAYADDSAGVVVIALGEIVATGPDGALRRLKRRSPFYEGDTILTGQKGRAQLRFNDGAIVSLSEDTELRIDRFAYSENGGEQKSFVTLVKGGFRTITGAIGKSDPDDYQVKTRAATIGIRGTSYELVQNADGLSVGVTKGGITVRNSAGTLDLGQGAAFNYAVVRGRATPPIGQLKPPPAFTQPQGSGAPETDNAEGTGESSDGGDAVQDTGTEESSNEGGGPSELGTPGGGSTSGDSEIGGFAPPEGELVVEQSNPVTSELTEVVAQLTPSTQNPSTDTGGEDDSGDGSGEPTTQTDGETSTITVTDSSAGSDGGVIVETDGTQAGTTVTDGSGTTTGGTTITDTGLVGVVVVPSPTNLPLTDPDTGDQFHGFGGGMADMSSGSPVIYDWNAGPGDPGYLVGDPDVIWTQGGATSTELTDASVPATWGIQWGMWNATACPGCAEAQTDPTDASVFVPVTSPVYWAVADISNVSKPTTGAFTYGSVLIAEGAGSGGPLDAGQFSFSGNLDFDSGLVEGGMYVVNGTDTWDINFSGQIGQQTLDVNIDTDSTVVTGAQSYGVDGSLGLVFVGPNGEGLAGGFALEADTDATIYSDGIMVVQQSGAGYPITGGVPTGDARLDDLSAGALDRLGIAVVPQSSANGGVMFAGASTDGGTGPVMHDHAPLLSEPDGPPQVDGVVLRPDATSNTGLPTHTTWTAGELNSVFGIQWGEWNSAGDPCPACVEAQTDSTDDTVATGLNGPVYWLTALPTATMPTTGQAVYGDFVMFNGSGSDGPIIWMGGRVDVDFGSGAVQGVLFIDHANDIWDVYFNGNVANNGSNQPYLDVTVDNANSLYQAGGGPEQFGVSGEVNGIFVGSSASGLAGGFHVELDADPNTYTSGIFGIEEGPPWDRFGLLVLAGNNTYPVYSSAGVSAPDGGIYGGAASDPGVSPEFYDWGVAPYDPNFGVGDPAVLFFQDGATNDPLATNTAVAATTIQSSFGVDWGVWNQGNQACPNCAVAEVDPADPAQDVGLDTPIFWLTAEETAVMPTTGTATYSDVMMFNGGSDMGQVTAFNFNATVDFSSGGLSGTMDITNGSAPSTQTWNLDLSGSVTDSYFNMNVDSTSTYTGPALGIPVGEVGGVFAGANADVMAGGFDVELDTDSTVHTEGIFVVGQPPQ